MEQISLVAPLVPGPDTSSQIPRADRVVGRVGSRWSGSWNGPSIGRPVDLKPEASIEGGVWNG